MELGMFISYKHEKQMVLLGGSHCNSAREIIKDITGQIILKMQNK